MRLPYAPCTLYTMYRMHCVPPLIPLIPLVLLVSPLIQPIPLITFVSLVPSLILLVPIIPLVPFIPLIPSYLLYPSYYFSCPLYQSYLLYPHTNSCTPCTLIPFTSLMHLMPPLISLIHIIPFVPFIPTLTPSHHFSYPSCLLYLSHFSYPCTPHTHLHTERWLAASPLSILHSYFNPITLFYIRSTHHKTCKSTKSFLYLVSKSSVPPKSMNSLTLNEPAMIMQHQIVGASKLKNIFLIDDHYKTLV